MCVCVACVGMGGKSKERVVYTAIGYPCVLVALTDNNHNIPVLITHRGECAAPGCDHASMVTTELK